MELNRRPSIKRNYVFNTLQQMVTMLAPLITTPYVSRVLGAEGIGIYSYTSANVTYFTLIGMLGIAGYGQREIAIIRDNKRRVSQLFWELNLLHIIIVLITLVPYIAVIVISDKYRLFYVINLITILASLIDINWFYQAYERFQFIAVRNCIIKVLTIIAIFMWIKNPGDLPLYIAIQLSAIFVANVSLWLSMRKYIYICKFDLRNLKHHLKESVVYFIPTIAASVYSVLDKSVINWVTHSDAQNGYYEQATKILSMCYVFTQSLSTVSAPRMTQLLAENKMKEAKARIEHSLQFMLLLSMPTMWGVIGIANRFVRVFFGDGYKPVEILLYIMMPLVVILGFSVYLDGMYLVPSGQRARSAKVVCIGAITNLVANLLLVYYFSAYGAGIATVITELLVAILMIKMSLQVINVWIIVKYVLRYCAYGMLLFFEARLIGQFISNDIACVITQIFICVISYFAVLLIFKDSLVKDLNGMLKMKIQHAEN